MRWILISYNVIRRLTIFLSFRFLKLTEKGWIEVSHEVAVEKASQSLRDTVASVKKGADKNSKAKDILDISHNSAAVASLSALRAAESMSAGAAARVDDGRSQLDLLRQRLAAQAIQTPGSTSVQSLITKGPLSHITGIGALAAEQLLKACNPTNLSMVSNHQADIRREMAAATSSTNKQGPGPLDSLRQRLLADAIRSSGATTAGNLVQQGALGQFRAAVAADQLVAERRLMLIEAEAARNRLSQAPLLDAALREASLVQTLSAGSRTLMSEERASTDAALIRALQQQQQMSRADQRM